MKIRLAAVVLAALLIATPALAQTPPTTPVTPPATQAPAPPAVFPADARIAFVDLQAVFNQSAFGRDALTQLQDLQQLNVDLQAKVQERDGLNQQIQSQRGIVSDAILAGWVSNLQRLEREAQFAQQEAEIQAEELRGTLIGQFEERVLPVIEAIRVERNLLAVFSVPGADDPSGGMRLVAADRGLNLSAEVVRRLDGPQ